MVRCPARLGARAKRPATVVRRSRSSSRTRAIRQDARTTAVSRGERWKCAATRSARSGALEVAPVGLWTARTGAGPKGPPGVVSDVAARTAVGSGARGEGSAPRGVRRVGDRGMSGARRQAAMHAAEGAARGEAARLAVGEREGGPVPRARRWAGLRGRMPSRCLRAWAGRSAVASGSVRPVAWPTSPSRPRGVDVGPGHPVAL